jgi:hypothetical protein
MSKLRPRISSKIIILLIGLVCLQFRTYYSDISGKRELKVTTWDALGYYIYLPAIFIYEDYKTYEWFPELDEEYQLSGGWVYQLSDLPNGNKVGKYLGGVAILQAPFFGIGHIVALNTDYKADGFSAPYQYAIAFGCIFWFLMGLLILRKVLRLFFSESVTAWTLAMLILATNAVQYSSVDNAMSHGFIFTLYAMLLFATVKWHIRPKAVWALFIGMVIGLACISRPTELIMILVPILWFTHNKEQSRAKWDLVRKYKHHILFLALGGILGVAPQIIYWKQVTGSFMYDVGSKWDFLQPHFQVLFGWKKGMFIYTPATILFIVGMFIAKKRNYPFRLSVIWFGLLNIYIIIAWHHWEYGASYATRALMQSYPIYALPLAVCISEMYHWKKWKWVAGSVALYLIGVNLFQTWQYNETVLHYNDMNRRYYGAIYLDRNPTPLDMSLLDTDEKFNSKGKSSHSIIEEYSDLTVNIPGRDSLKLYSGVLPSLGDFENGDVPKRWLKIKAKLNLSQGLWNSSLNVQSRTSKGEVLKSRSFRLSTPIVTYGEENDYELHFKLPKDRTATHLHIALHSDLEVKGNIVEFKVLEFR